MSASSAAAQLKALNEGDPQPQPALGFILFCLLFLYLFIYFPLGRWLRFKLLQNSVGEKVKMANTTANLGNGQVKK